MVSISGSNRVQTSQQQILNPVPTNPDLKDSLKISVKTCL